MHRDCRNLAVSASSPASVEMLDAAVASYLGMRKDVGDRAAALVEADPDIPLGHCLVGYLNLHAGKREMLPYARRSLERAQACAATARERLHVGALEAWLNGNFGSALDCWEQILAADPLDVLALRLAQFITSYLGQTSAVLATVARVLRAWKSAVPAYGFVLGCYAYGLEESGEYERAERAGREAVELNPEDLWATHAVAHVMEMQCRPREGVAWVNSRRAHLAACGNFVRHLWWHNALFLLTLGDFDGVLEVYDHDVRAESTGEYLDIANSASVLWRLEQAGVNVGNRWQELAMRAESRMHDHLYVLADLHYMFALAAGSSSAAIEAFLASCEDYARDDTRTEARIMHRVGLGAAKAVIHHRNHRFAEAVDAALPVCESFNAIGGSHAQRDIFDHMLVDAAIRADRLPLARQLLRERTARRPCELWTWKHLAHVSSILKNEADLMLAQANIQSLVTRNAQPQNGDIPA